MSYTYLQEQGEVSSAGCFSDIPQSVLLNLNLTAERFYSKDNGTGFCQSSQSGMMSAPSTELRGEEKSMSSAEDSLAKTSAAQEEGKESEGPGVGCGSKWPESFATFDRALSSWKTRQRWLFEDLDVSLETWPRWGLMLHGECWERTMPALRINANESGSWPTPQRVDYKGACANSKTNQRSAAWKIWSQGKYQTGSIYPNPTAYEVLMGWPMGWTESKPLETDKFQAWQHSHGESLEENK